MSRCRAFGDQIDHTLFDPKNHIAGKEGCRLEAAYGLPKTKAWLEKMGSFEKNLQKCVS